MGRDKSQLKLEGKSFVERAVLALSVIAPKNITLVGEMDRQSLEIKLPNDAALQLRVINDVPVENQTARANRTRAAIIGLYTALSHAETQWLAVLACDLPFVSGELFERLVFLLENDKANIKNFGAVMPIQSDGREQPLFALYRRAACLSAAEETLAGEDWSLRKLLRRVETLFISFDKIIDLQDAEHFFFSANTPEDYDEARRIELLKNG